MMMGGEEERRMKGCNEQIDKQVSKLAIPFLGFFRNREEKTETKRR